MARQRDADETASETNSKVGGAGAASTQLQDLQEICDHMQEQLGHHRGALEQCLEVRETVLELHAHRETFAQCLQFRDGIQAVSQCTQMLAEFTARTAELDFSLAGVSDNIARHGRAISSLAEQQKRTSATLDAVVRAVKRLARSRSRSRGTDRGADRGRYRCERGYSDGDLGSTSPGTTASGHPFAQTLLPHDADEPRMLSSRGFDTERKERGMVVDERGLDWWDDGTGPGGPVDGMLEPWQEPNFDGEAGLHPLGPADDPSFAPGFAPAGGSESADDAWDWANWPRHRPDQADDDRDAVPRPLSARGPWRRHGSGASGGSASSTARRHTRSVGAGSRRTRPVAADWPGPGVPRAASASRPPVASTEMANCVKGVLSRIEEALTKLDGGPGRAEANGSDVGSSAAGGRRHAGSGGARPSSAAGSDRRPQMTPRDAARAGGAVVAYDTKGRGQRPVGQEAGYGYT